MQNKIEKLFFVSEIIASKNVALPYLLIPVKKIQVEKVSLSDTQNLRTVR